MPAGSRTRTESAESETPSLKVRVTAVGAVGTTAFCAGSVPTSVACADAVPAPPISRAATAPRTATSDRAAILFRNSISSIR